ncbi:hypothetical protein [Kocuria palustris]|nr:hypothetical protein [Kocuria palustris]
MTENGGGQDAEAATAWLEQVGVEDCDGRREVRRGSVSLTSAS